MLGRRKPALRLDVHLKLLIVADRACSDTADRCLDVLRLDGTDHVRRSELQIVEALGIEPDAHRIIECADQGSLADAGGAGKNVEYIDHRVVGDEQGILGAVVTVEHDELQDGRRFLLNAQSFQLDLLRKLSERGLHAIVHVDGVDVWIAAEQKADGESVAAIIAARRLHVDHLVDADDLRLDGLGNALFDDRRGSARIRRRHHHLGRHDVGKLRDRNPR